MLASLAKLSSLVIAAYDKVIAASAFPGIASIEAEQGKAGILRIILGIVIFVRFAEITHTLIVLDQSTKVIFLAFIILIAIIAFTIGFITPLSTLILLASVIMGDRIFGTTTLGTSVLIITLLPMFLINAGRYHSLDHWLSGYSRYKTFLNVLDAISSVSNKSDITRAYFLSFLLYAIMSFGALSFHLQDDYWTGGLTVKTLLINSYLCKYHTWFIYLDRELPFLMSLLSISAGIFQSVFQFLMIPLIFFKLGRQFVFYYGMNFFLISLFFINLSYLPHIEIVLWILIMFPASVATGQSQTAGTEELVFKKPLINLSFLKPAIYIIYPVLIMMYILFEFPYIRKMLPTAPRQVYTVLDIAGFDMPNVFNVTDLSMGNHWMEIHRKSGSKWELVPLSGYSGERLNPLGYDILNFANHNSDLLYFGTTLAFRRGVMGRTLDDYFKTSYGLSNLLRRIRYDYKLNDFNNEVDYLIRVYMTSASEVTHASSDPENFAKKLIFETVLSYDGLSLKNRTPVAK